MREKITESEYAATPILKFHFNFNIERDILLPYLLENDNLLEIYIVKDADNLNFNLLIVQIKLFDKA